MSEYRIDVEAQMTRTLKPIGFGVFADGRFVAALTEEQIRAALKHFDVLKQQYEASRN